MYSATPGGQDWWELDDKHERIMETEDHRGKHDLDSPYDPETVDAPEDIQRVGNDHQPLSNAKLSPDGYHNGFPMAKDAFGNYAQRSHHHHHYDPTMVMYDHENDTDDLADGLDPIYNQRGSALNFIRLNEMNEHAWQIVPESDNEFVQFDHDNDTDDIA